MKPINPGEDLVPGEYVENQVTFDFIQRVYLNLLSASTASRDAFCAKPREEEQCA